jgi:hypothetical protein
MTTEIREPVLLTGAGFTRNFGGFLADQMWARIFNQCYFKLFEDVLSRRNRRLLVIGYGFKDAHINQVIAHSIRKCGLKLYVISPSSAKGFRGTLLENLDEDKKTLWEGLAGYWDCELKDVCPASENYFSEEIRRAIFQSFSIDTMIPQGSQCHTWNYREHGSFMNDKAKAIRRWSSCMASPVTMRTGRLRWTSFARVNAWLPVIYADTAPLPAIQPTVISRPTGPTSALSCAA